MEKRSLEKIEYALVNGINEFIEMIPRFRKTYKSPLEIIEGPLLDGMNVVGDFLALVKCFYHRLSNQQG